ncbi:MAG: hypothetical protein L0154_00570, partial [Chloroflexi bacterium]|nr:hypothetical protein [Chloroflexota bacterium]
SVSEQALHNLPSGYAVLALMDMYRELALIYEILENERALSIEQVRQLTAASPEVFLQTGVIRSGAGWHSSEYHAGLKFAWVGNDAELIILASNDRQYPLYIDLEPGPSASKDGLELVIYRADGLPVSSFLIRARQKIYLTLPLEPNTRNIFILHVDNGDLPVANDPRKLNFRVFAMGAYKATQPEQPYTLRAAEDIIALGQGWYPQETQTGRGFRWANNDCEIIVYNATGRYRKVALDVQAGPSLQDKFFQMDVLDADDFVVASQKVRGTAELIVELPIEAGQHNCFRLRVHGGGLPVPNDPRTLNFRIFGIGWARA